MSQKVLYLLIFVILCNQFSCKDEFLEFILNVQKRNEIFEYKIKSDQNISNLIKKILIDLDYNSIETARSEYKLLYKKIDLLDQEIQDTKIYFIFRNEINKRTPKFELELNSFNDQNSIYKQEFLKKKLDDLIKKLNSDKKLNLNYINKNIREKTEESLGKLRNELDNSFNFLVENVKRKEEYISKINSKISDLGKNSKILSGEELKSFVAPFLIDKYEEFLMLKNNQINKLSEEIESNIIAILFNFILIYLFSDLF